MQLSGRRHIGTLAIIVVSLCISVVSASTDWIRLLENEQHAAVAALGSRDASGQIHIVEVDAESIASIRQWPWKREHYARLVEQLDEAGARSIVFDIDFSSPSSADGDAQFANAIADARASVVMPTFAQNASETLDRQLDTLPIAPLREHASLASVSVIPDADARVRKMLYGTMTQGIARPTLSAQIAGQAGSIDSAFAIDFSIDPQSIPRHSFIDVERGQFDRRSVEGKDILVGATAIELGDRYGVPVYGVVPGVTIQALASETLLSGGLRELGWVPLILVAALLAIFIANARSYVEVAARAGGGLLAISAITIAAYHGAMTLLDMMPAAVTILVAGLAQSIQVARRQLRERALIDPDSGLPNSRAFARRSHDDDQLIAAAYIADFDSIRAVLAKDEQGKIIERLIERMNAAHPIGEAFHADTRVIAWTHKGEHRDLVNGLEKISAAMQKPIEIGATRIDLRIAFGIAAGADLASAMLAASEAAKEQKLWHAHESTEAAIIEQRVSLMGELDEAIESDELKVVYQPKLRLETDRIESVEALVRWEHPKRGFLSPDTFIPLAEEANRIEALTLFVLNRTIDDLAGWCREGIVISAAVNVSANLVSSERFVSAVERILSNTGVPRERVILEVTESAAMRDPETAVRNLERFRKLGVHISMDDYGTGQSTLSYLQKLPLTELKIDRAFVQNAHEVRSDALLVRSSIQLAHSLGLRVVCEGVEDEACLQFLRANDCDYAQGYFISKPLSSPDLMNFLNSSQFSEVA
ncbi:putative bifunctional diguanylate cyclase/phosphodiesterase [Erythrobacter sp.]|jgi:EAL domain-containing protein (putative c-di-GMP-specific phosphodiesterase class I)/CHASE2 domain-containing sensor protein|uniref:putative bifunctional diguanylate cyclase/phosphodiesterase n=1 Tax=Erythrobacter sp. TaxID=1042 RepID=UPI002EBE482B|nr:EAL domain-containing protein [Erythrobacter sp.]